MKILRTCFIRFAKGCIGFLPGFAAIGCTSPAQIQPRAFVESNDAIAWVYQAERRCAVSESDDTLYLPLAGKWSNQISGITADDECVTIQEAIQGVDLPLLTAGGRYRTVQLRLADGTVSECSGTQHASSSLDVGPDDPVEITNSLDLLWTREGKTCALLLSDVRTPQSAPIRLLADRGELAPTRVLHILNADKLLIVVQMFRPGTIGAEDYVVCVDLKRLSWSPLNEAIARR